MPSLLIRLNPQLLSNPDLDIRYELPDRLHDLSNGLLRPDGFDYEDGTDALLIFMEADDLEAVIPVVINALENEEVLGNRLAMVARVGASPFDNADVLSDFVAVYPQDEAGSQMA
ncbi:MAG: hypothetical protein LBI76_08675 [Comamonas sp.]|jgi:hypothetical protein|nr:hypothetical protein [Comamonas sp.]